ncbi:hypothetical protein ABZP36_005053 [Zizania latifolia]
MRMRPAAGWAAGEEEKDRQARLESDVDVANISSRDGGRERTEQSLSGHPAPDARALDAPGARSGLSHADLKQAIADSKRQGYLGFGEFVAAMQLVSLAQVGNEMTQDSLKREDLINLDPPVMEGLDELLAAPLRSKCLLIITDSVQNQKRRYLFRADLTVGQFVYVVRKRIKLSPEKAIFVFVKNTLPPTASLMSAIYEESKDEDGFLYMTYSGESTFSSA